MKMKKRILAGMMMAIMVVASVMSVSAAPSKQEPVVEAGSATKYEIATGTKEFTGIKEEKEAAVKAQIADLEADKAVSLNTDTDKAIKDKTMATDFFDLIVKEGTDHSACTTKGYHTLTLKVDAMTSSWKNIVVLHYSTVRDVWEAIPVDAKNVKYDAKTITFDIKDLSPMAIYADIVDDGSEGTSPKTEGMSSTWMLWAAVALVLVGSGVVVSQKKRG